MILLIIFLHLTSLFLRQTAIIAVDILTPNQSLTDKNGDTLLSPNQTFVLGFFSPWNTNNRYLGIWYNKVSQQTPVWVANKNNPLTNSSGVLTITPAGNIVITSNRTDSILWTSDSSSSAVRNPILQLMDTGNLVVRNESDDSGNNYLWQSFDHPSDTLIAGMKLGWNLQKNQEWYLTSWRTPQDPSSGDYSYTYRVDPTGLPQIVLRRHSRIIYRSGPWDGTRFGGGAALPQNPVMISIFVFDTNNVYYSFENIDASTIIRIVVNPSGLIQILSWSPTRTQWDQIITLQGDSCDTYDLCGPNGICNEQPNNYNCQCPDGFTPRFPQDWKRFDWSGGCIRNRALNCSDSETDGFMKFSGLKLPDNSYFMDRTATNANECEKACLANCSCLAYAKTEITGCIVWSKNLTDLRYFSEGGQDLYIRLDASQLGSSKNTKRTAMITSMSVVSGIIILGLISLFVYRKITANQRQADLSVWRQENLIHDNNQSTREEDLELPLFDLATISAATSNFSTSNKVGEGGFGPVYKGKLQSRDEIAVKRLSRDSGQGLREFKNEVILISKLQHRNLVRMLGCCIHVEERILIYEYMPNKSLDFFLFNQERRRSLDWGKRFDIIIGIARGLLYLHRDSRLRIIHRDLKVSNILLDQEMNPKISDFGLARTFGGDQSEENTKRVIGTYGYMSPEYALDGLFSVKSDVFSFGVLVLEMVSGMKNRGFYHPDHDLNLLGHAWKLWNEGNPLKLMDSTIENQVLESKVIRCIHVGLLCVQHRPEERPTMSSALLMLDSENPMLPQPKQPGFYSERFTANTHSSSMEKMHLASNDVTVTLLQGR